MLDKTEFTLTTNKSTMTAVTSSLSEEQIANGLKQAWASGKPLSSFRSVTPAVDFDSNLNVKIWLPGKR